MRTLALAAVVALTAVHSTSTRPQDAAPVVVVFETSQGAIEIEVDVQRAPISAANFLKYVDEGLYTGGRFHRAVRPDTETNQTTPIQVIQAGRVTDRERPSFPAIPLERTRDTGLLHKDGVVSMARSAAADSARSDFFICIGDQPSLDFAGPRNADGQGFAAFGRVIKGMDVVRAIQASPVRAGSQTLDPPIAIVKAARQASPLAIGETFTIESQILGETRRINVYVPPVYGESKDAPLPVLYMPDGGIAEDFLHVAGLVQVSVGNGTMRPFILVGIENTQRRRDMTGPTTNAEDRKIAAVVGSAEAFRRFIRSELMPAITTRYRTTAETAIIGESLAGLFVVETFLVEPDLFDTSIAFDPSLWWNNSELVTLAAGRLKSGGDRKRALYLASSSEPELARLTSQLADILRKTAPADLAWHYEPMPGETHATIYHPAALLALRRLFKPAGR